MATSNLTGLVRELRRTARSVDEMALTDGQLLGRFIDERAEAAFAELLRRHGPMVWGVCRRVLSGGPDAEDAFQATFLVLVRRATSVVPRDMVANWLHGVALQTALKARATAARRRGRERSMMQLPEPAAAERDCLHDLRSLLDQELGRLPDRYRAAVVLCDLEGQTRKDAARQLGLAEGTVASRLARGRALLAKRLARHGLPVTAGALTAALAREASAGVPAVVSSSTLKAAGLLAAGQTAAIPANVLALAEGVRHTMRLANLKTAVALAGLLFLLGLALPAYRGFAQQKTPDPQPKPAAAKPVPPPAKPKYRYCRLVFGPKGDTRVLVRLDGDAIAVDRDGDGKFDGKDEQFKSLKDCKDVSIADADGTTAYVITLVDDLKLVPLERFLEIRVHVKGSLDYPQACLVSVGERPDDAPEARLHGPLTVAPKSWRFAHRALQAVENPLVNLKSLVPQPLVRLGGKGLSTEPILPRKLKRGESTDLMVTVMTEGRNTFSCVCSPGISEEDRREKAPFPKGVHPVADIEFPAKKPGDPPIKQRFALDQFVGDGGFRGPVAVPADAGAGVAKITFSFDAWKGANVAPTTVEIPLADPPERKDNGR